MVSSPTFLKMSSNSHHSCLPSYQIYNYFKNIIYIYLLELNYKLMGFYQSYNATDYT